MPPSPDQPAPRPGFHAFAEALKVLADAATRLGVVLLAGLLIFAPGSIALLDRFLVRPSKVNILGSEIEIVDSRLLGLEIKGDRLVLNGRDLNDYITASTGDAQRIRALTDENKALAEQLQQTRHLLEQVQKANERLPPDLGATAREATATLNRQIAANVAASDARLQSAQQVLAQEPAAPAATGVRNFAVMLSSDAVIGQGGAKDELAKAGEFGQANPPAPPARVFFRNNFFATALLFESREAANQALPRLRQFRWRDAYVADLRSWCPAGLGTEPVVRDGIAYTNCRF